MAPSVASKKIPSDTTGDSFLFLDCTLSVLLCPDCPGFAFCSYYTTTRHKHPCPRRDSKPNPSKRSTADPRLKSLGQWDRPRSRDPSTSSSVPLPLRYPRPPFDDECHLISPKSFLECVRNIVTLRRALALFYH
jgi:hypothetical protein